MKKAVIWVIISKILPLQKLNLVLSSSLRRLYEKLEQQFAMEFTLSMSVAVMITADYLLFLWEALTMVISLRRS